MDSYLKAEDLTGSMGTMDKMFGKELLNIEAKFGLMRAKAIKLPNLGHFVVLRSPKNYEGLKKVGKDFEEGLKAMKAVRVA